ncbi:reverse transcriptase-like protein [Salibacterium aidingense]|uniref:reverse transcriptase-like protein n=1 Tax=Salibacterium aidingense TaxID=384933 RepID=UPI0003FAC1C5|nr:reverse transcriptase-like protein [Salibacterium aidingense]
MILRLEITYQTKKGTKAVFRSEEMSAEKAEEIADDFERTGRVHHIVFLDYVETTWTRKELKEYQSEIQTEPHDISVYFDGGFDRNSKKSGLGCVIYYNQNSTSLRLRKNAKVEELHTNNEAEYAALYLGLQQLEDLGAHHIPVTFYGDSQVVLNQLKGEWPCLERDLSYWIDRCEEKLNVLGMEPEYEQIPRKKNREADRLASQALQGIEVSSTKEV